MARVGEAAAWHVSCLCQDVKRRFPLKLAWIPTLVLGLGATLPASAWIPRSNHVSSCIPLGAVERNGNPACWVSWWLPDGAGRFCVPREVWFQELSPGEAAAASCAEWPGKWRLSAPPMNAPEGGSPPGSPRARLLFFASAPPVAPSERRNTGAGWAIAVRRTAGAGWALALERWREETSHLLEPYDPLGALRFLVTGTRVSGPHADLTGILIGLRPFVASGLHLFALARWIDRGALALAEAGWAPPGLLLPISRLATALAWAAAWFLAGARPGMLRPWIAWTLRASAERAGARWQPWAPVALAALAEGAWALCTGRPAAEHAVFAAAAAWAAAGPRRRARSWAAEAAITAAAAGAGSALLVAWRDGLLALSAPLAAALLLPWAAWIAYPAALVAVGLHALGSGPAAAALAGFAGATTGYALLTALRASLAVPALWTASHRALAAAAAASALAHGALIARYCRARHPSASRFRGEGWLRRYGESSFAAAGAAALLLAAIARMEIDPLAASRHAALDPPAAAGRTALDPRATAWTRSPEAASTRGPEAAAVSVTQLDVGQGDSALVRAPRSIGLIDAGAENALGDGAWMRLLAQRGITAIDWVALTHLDEDHVGGLRRLARIVPVGCVETSALELASPRGERLAAELRSEGIDLRPWRGGCVPYPVEPPRAWPLGARSPAEPQAAGGRREASGRAKKNDHMGAVFVPLARGGFYLSAGDADALDEPRIGAWAAALGAGLGSPRILKVSHHGSRTSSTPQFLALVKPDQCWISVGTGNLYGHPSPEVLGRLAAAGCTVRRTDEAGRIESD